MMSTHSHTKTLVLLSLSTLMDTVAYTGMFGYLPELLQEFGIAIKDIGYYQGAIVAEYTTGCCLSLVLLTKFIGKINIWKTFVAFSAFHILVFVFLALTNSLPLLLAAVFFASILLIKAPIYDVIVYRISDETNQSQYFNYALTAPYNAGLFLGPALGGILSFPVDQYPNIFPRSALMKNYPIFLANITYAILMVAITVLAVYVLPKDLDEAKNDTESTSFLLNEIEDSSNSNRSRQIKNVLRDRNVYYAMTSYFIYAIVTGAFVNLYSVWSQTPIHLGGVGYTPRNAGLVLLIAGVLVLVVDLVLVGRSFEWLGLKRTLQFWTLLEVVMISFPLECRLINIEQLKFAILVLMMASVRVCTTGIRVGVSTILYNIIPSQLVAEAMSLRLCIEFACHAVGQVMIGSLFAWSISKEDSTDSTGFPFNHVFSFYLLSSLMMICLFIQSFLNEKINQRPNV